MRKEVKDNLLQALGAAIMVEPIDGVDAAELVVVRRDIKATLKAWVEYENSNTSKEQP